MPNPNPQSDNELLERAKRLAGQISDPNVLVIGVRGDRQRFSFHVGSLN
jgi:hypothetical protein